MERKQRVIVYIDGFNFYFGLKSNANWKKYYWLDVVKLFEMFMRPNQFSSNLATMGMGRPIHMKQYESRFKQCLFPDVVHLENADFDLHIPEKWKAYQ